MTLNHENYFSQEAMTEYMSSSQFKAFEVCEAAAMANLTCSEKKTCYTEGSFFEAIICGKSLKYLDHHPEILTKAGQIRANYQAVFSAADQFTRQKVFKNIIDRCEQQVIVTGKLSGVLFKGCIDFYDPETGNGYDAKYVKDLGKVWSPADHAKVNWYFARGYHYQAAIYRELIRQTFGKWGKQHLIVATKESVPNLAFLQFADTILDDALEIIYEFAPKYANIKNGLILPSRCESCDYCKQTRIITASQMIGEYE